MGIKAYFFDVDGTLTDENGVISADMQAVVRKLAAGAEIYLATSLPYQEARRTCRGIWERLSGGAFAEGSDIRVFGRGYERVIPLGEAKRLKMTLTGAGRVREYRRDGVLHKVTVSGRTWTGADVLAWKTDFPEFHVVFEDGRLGITDCHANKLDGVLHICGKMGYGEEEVAVVGNGENDLAMLRHFPKSYAVSTSGEQVRAAAGDIFRIEEFL